MQVRTQQGNLSDIFQLYPVRESRGSLLAPGLKKKINKEFPLKEYSILFI